MVTIRLGQVAQGGPTKLSPTPAQVAVRAATQIALLPSRQSAALLTKAVNLVQRSRDSAEQAVQTTRNKVEKTTKATIEVAEAGRDAALARAEEVPPSADVRRAAHEAREDLGTIEARDLPVKGYENLSGASASKAIKLDTVKDVRLVLRFEQAHQNRKGATSAAQQWNTDFAKQIGQRLTRSLVTVRTSPKRPGPSPWTRGVHRYVAAPRPRLGGRLPARHEP